MSDSRVVAPWAEFLPKGEHISAIPSYPSGKYLELFDEYVFPVEDEEVGDITYYLYDPVKHGGDAGKKYPLLFWLHGAGNSLAGRLCINYAGAEMFASPEYQEQIGGAYILVPLANESMGDGFTAGTWMTTHKKAEPARYSPEVQALLDNMIAKNPMIGSLIGAESIYSPWLLALHDAVRGDHCAIDMTILCGTSAGGYGAWRQLINNPDRYAAALIMAGAYLPDLDELSIIERSGLALWICHGLRDECVEYAHTIEPNLDRLRAMPNVELTLLDWVRNGDGGILSVVDGIEMGQHCICSMIQQNLILDDGTICDLAHPNGVTGWIAEQVRRRRDRRQ